jgi:hypothetical protein
MLKWFQPYFTGTYSPESLRPDFISALAARVRKGLFPYASERRNRYEVESESKSHVRFRSKGMLTSISIGWNDVKAELDASSGPSPRIRYEVGFFAWARYGVILCASLGVLLAASWSLVADKHRPQQGGATWIFWAMVIFWGFIWPWILVGIHKRPARRMLNRLFDQVNGDAA